MKSTGLWTRLRNKHEVRIKQLSSPTPKTGKHLSSFAKRAGLNLNFKMSVGLSLSFASRVKTVVSNWPPIRCVVGALSIFWNCNGYSPQTYIKLFVSDNHYVHNEEYESKHTYAENDRPQLTTISQMRTISCWKWFTYYLKVIADNNFTWCFTMNTVSLTTF